MMQGLLSVQNTRPGRVLHLACIVAVFVYALVAKFYESLGVVPADDFVAEVDILSLMRIGFVLVGLAGLAIAIIFLRRPHRVGSIGTAFVLAYAMLDALSIYGLVLFLMGVRWLDFYLFAVPSLVGLLLLWTQARWWDRLTAMEQHELEMTGEEYG